MTLVPSLLQAIILMDGEALVLHVGDKPYVVADSGQVNLANAPLTAAAIADVIEELLPPESKIAFADVGATQCLLPEHPSFPRERFSVVAARGGADVWLEIRRAPGPRGQSPFSVGRPATEDLSAALDNPPVPDVARFAAPAPWVAPPVATTRAPEPVFAAVAAPMPVRAPEAEASPMFQPMPMPETAPAPVPVAAPGPVATPPPVPAPAPVAQFVPPPAPVAEPEPVPAPVAAQSEPQWPVLAPAPTPVPAPAATSVPAPTLVPTVAHHPPAPLPPSPQPAPLAAVEPPPLVVVPPTRPSLRAFSGPNLPEPAASGLERLLRLAAARGASTLYLVSGAPPTVRVDDEVRPLEGAGTLESHELEAILLSLAPEQGTATTGNAVAAEWTSDFADLGSVRGLSFRDHRGPGCVFRLMPRHVLTTQQLGLPRDVQTLIGETEGLVVVTGPRLGGKRTLMAAFVDQVNRTRPVHVITIEHDVAVVHDRAQSLVSQREVRDRSRAADAARQALREDPDVLVLEDVHSAELLEIALDAAAGGRLVICGCAARGAAAAIDRLLELSPASERRQTQLLLATNLRAVVAQVLLRKAGGGRLAAREVLLNTPAIAALIAEGRTSQLQAALDDGRRQGMVPLNEALVSLVQSGDVDVAEAWRASPDRQGLATLLHRRGIDTTAVERLA